MTTTLNASTAGAGGFIATSDNSGSLALQTAGTTAVTIDTSQKVGIGTTSPANSLNVYNASAVQALFNGYSGIASRSQVAAGSIALGNNAGYQLQIDYSDASNTTATIKNTYANTASLLQIQSGYLTFGTGASFAEAMRIDSSGNLLVGGTSVVYYSKVLSQFDGATKFGFVANETSGTSGAGFHAFTVNGTAIGSITRVSSTSAVNFNSTSDQRLKSNISDSQSVLDKLMTIKVRQFDWTGGDVHQDYGFIAQELEPLLSGIVTKGKTDEDMWQLDYAKLTPHLVKAIQELKAINDTQAETINALTARIVALESK
jgi:hypothetical protein